MANTLAHARQRFFDAQGVPLAFGKVWTYDAGTTVPRPTFADAGEVTANPNPVILDANGEATIYWRGTYKVNLTTSADVQVPGWPEDNVSDNGTAAMGLAADLASTASGKGAALVGADAAVDYPDDTIGFLVVKNTSNGYNALRGFSKVEQALIQAGTSVSDHAATLDSMLSTEKHLFLPRGTFRRSTKWGITNGLRLEGAGQGQAIILLTADVVGLELTGEFVRVEGVGIAKTGTHTSNGINIGTAAGARADRAHLHDIVVTGMGNDGIVLYAGNLGTLATIRTRSNGRDGINFNRAASVDNHAWKIDGFIDTGLNGRHGFMLEDGTSLGDANASKTHHGGTIVAQSNTGYGVYIGSSRNRLTVYSESNTAGQVYIGQFAGGNEICVVEGVVTGNVGGVAGSLDGNHIIQLNHNANTRAGYKSKLELSGGAGKGCRIAGDDGTAGFVEIEKKAARELRITGSGSGAAWNTYFDHSSGTGVLHQVNFGGGVVPMADNAAGYTLGTTSLRWATASIVELRPGAGAVKWSSGTGSPEGVYTGPVGSMWLRTDGGAGTVLYVKESGTGNTGWVAK